MKIQAIFIMALVLSLAVIGCSSQEQDETIIQEEAKSQDLPEETSSQAIDELLISGDEYIEIGEMI